MRRESRGESPLGGMADRLSETLMRRLCIGMGARIWTTYDRLRQEARTVGMGRNICSRSSVRTRMSRLPKREAGSLPWVIRRRSVSTLMP